MPNKIKVVLAFVAIVAGFSVYGLSRYLSVLAGNGPTLILSAPAQDAISCATCDPDHDGITNAQESAWGTDPLNPDSDRDGFKDGEEVKSGHNPLVPGPNDTLSSDNLTDQFSHLVASGVAAGALDPSKGTYSHDLAMISDSLADSAKFTLAKTVDPTSLTVIKSTPVTDQAYLNQFVALAKTLNQILDREYSNASNNLNAIGMNGFDIETVHGFYVEQTKAAEDLVRQGLAIAVPTDFKDAHLQFLDLVQEIANASQAVENGGQDPVKATVALKMLAGTYSVYLSVLTTYNQVVTAKHIDFQPLTTPTP